jgi:hypothetical protein
MSANAARAVARNRVSTQHKVPAIQASKRIILGISKGIQTVISLGQEEVRLWKALVFPFPPGRLLAKRAFRLRFPELSGTLHLR